MLRPKLKWSFWDWHLVESDPLSSFLSLNEIYLYEFSSFFFIKVLDLGFHSDIKFLLLSIWKLLFSADLKSVLWYEGIKLTVLFSYFLKVGVLGLKLLSWYVLYVLNGSVGFTLYGRAIIELNPEKLLLYDMPLWYVELKCLSIVLFDC